MNKKTDIKKTFFDKLAGAVNIEEDGGFEEDDNEKNMKTTTKKTSTKQKEKEIDPWTGEEDETAELNVDVYQKNDKIIIKTIIAGVKPENLDVSITRDMVTITGKRKEQDMIIEDNYFQRELFWGSFSKVIMLPEEIDVEESEAVEEHGILTITLPKVNKEKKAKLKVKSL